MSAGKSNLKLLSSNANPINFPQSPSIIPKTPQYRVVKFSFPHQLQQIRSKLWKIDSFQINLFDKDRVTALSQRRVNDKIIKSLPQTLRTPSFKKAFKNIKRFNFIDIIPKDAQPNLIISKSWKLKSFQLRVYQTFLQAHALGQSITRQNLHTCCIAIYRVNYGQDPFPSEKPVLLDLISSFRSSKACSLEIDYSIQRHKVLINSQHIRKRKVTTQEMSKAKNWIELATLRSLRGIEGVSYYISQLQGDDPNVKLDLPQLPNLKILSLNLDASEPRPQKDDLSFLKQYKTLESVNIKLDYRLVKSLEPLASLPQLRNFSLSCRQISLKKGFLGKFSQTSCLETMRLSLSGCEFDAPEFQKFFQSNKTLRSVELNLEIGMASEILVPLEEQIISVKELKILAKENQMPDIRAVKKLGANLGRLSGLKSLELLLPKSKGNVNEEIFKGVENIKALERFKLDYRVAGSLEDDKFESLGALLGEMKELKVLDLNLENDNLCSNEFSGIVEGLMELKKLESLRMILLLGETKGVIFDRFEESLKSIQDGAKEIDLTILGCTLAQELRLSRLVKNECYFWDD